MFEQLELCATILSDLRWELGEGIPGAAWLLSSASLNLFSLLLWSHPDGSKLWYSVGKKDRKSTNQLHFANKEVHFCKHNLGINCELSYVQKWHPDQNVYISMIVSLGIYEIIQLRQNSNNNIFFKKNHTHSNFQKKLITKETLVPSLSFTYFNRWDRQSVLHIRESLKIEYRQSFIFFFLFE